MKRITAILLLPLMWAFSSCSTDFDVNADWQDITVVYGLLNQNDSISYLKINKAFLGEGNALVMAQIEDSSSYFNDLEVKVEEWEINPKGDPEGFDVKLLNTIVFDTTRVTNKEPGTFYYPDQIIYKALTYQKLNQDNRYKLFITNKKTGKQISGKTILVNNFYLKQPGPSTKFIKFKTNESHVEWVTGKNGRRYEVKIRFHYKELPATGGTDTVFKTFDWTLPTLSSAELTGGEVMSLPYVPKFFYTLLQKEVPKDPSIIRFVGKVDFIVSVAADEYATFMDVVAPSSSVVQEKPDYTNITNGIGIFSSRFYIKKSLTMETTSVDTLKTLGLGFQ